jgi:hypothetical protein
VWICTRTPTTGPCTIQMFFSCLRPTQMISNTRL